MAYTVSQSDIAWLTSRNRTIDIKIELLNARMQIIETLHGECIDAPFSFDSESDMRRVCSLNLTVKSKSSMASKNAHTWFDKKVRVYYGVYTDSSKTFVYYRMGTFVLADGEYSFDASSMTLNVNLADLMAFATDVRGSAIGASKIVIEAGTDRRTAMIHTVTELAGFSKYSICLFDEDNGKVPYDLELDNGAYPNDIIVKLRDLYPYYETFADPDGVFVCRKIPTALSDPVLLSAEIMDRLIVENGIKSKINLSEVKNTTEVWGRKLTADRWSETCTSLGNTYCLSIPDIEAMDHGITYGFTVDAASLSGQKIKINGLPACQIVESTTNSDGTIAEVSIAAGRLKRDTAYVFLYSGGKFYLQGELEIHVVVMELNKHPDSETDKAYRAKLNCNNIRYVINPESPFAADRAGVGIIRQVFHGEDFEDIYTTELAYDRAAYENWKTTRLAEKMDVECLMIPWIDANTKIEFTSPLTQRVEQYITTGASFNMTQATMTLNVVRFYPYYPWLPQ